MNKKILLTTGLAILSVLVALTGCSSEATEQPSTTNVNVGSQQEGLWVNGHGEVNAVPDVASLQLGISSQQATVAEAQAEAATAMDKVVASLKSNGVAEKDIQTQQFSVQQVTRWDPDKQQEIVTGYVVNNMVMVKVRQITSIGTVIDAVVAAGGDNTRINSIAFSIEDPTTYQKEARDEAMANAKAKAEQLATLSGVSLGKPTYISESTNIPIYQSPVGISAVPAPSPAPVTPVSAGELTIKVDIQVVYDISS